MTIKEKLLYFRDKIQMSIELNEELKNLISIELFDYIRHNADLKEEFFRRAGYFNDLVKDKKVVSIQENLFKKIVSVLQITDIQEIEKLQKQLDTEQKNTYKLINRLKYKGKMSDDEDYALTLIETYQALQDKSSYFKLGFKGGSTYSTEISYFQHTVQTIEQYRMAEALFNLISLNIIIDDEVLYKKFEQAIKEYNKFWFEFNELIYRTPIRLHTRAFENFILFCSTTTEIEGYEPYHKLHGLFENDKLSEIRKFVMAVIDDLIEFSETKAEAGAENKKLLINLDTFRFSEEFERTRKNTQAIAEELNKSFARDKEAFEITRAWFTAICRSTTPVMQQYQQTLENLAIQIEPFRQKLEEQA